MSDTHSQGDDRVAVLGTGIMGAAMARSLLAAGVPATVWDRPPEATAPLAAAGARVAPSAAEAARAARGGGRPGEPPEAGRQRLHVGPHRRRRGSGRAGRTAGRRHRAAR